METERLLLISQHHILKYVFRRTRLVDVDSVSKCYKHSVKKKYIKSIHKTNNHEQT